MEDGKSDGKVEKQQFRNLIDARGFQRFRSFLFDMRRSIRKVMYRFNWWGPEIGLSSCMFKYAWYKYPIIPQTTYRMMGTARRMMTNFAYDFYQGFMEEQMRDHHRISNKVAQTTAEDFENYQYEYYPDFKEMGPHASIPAKPFYSVSNNNQQQQQQYQQSLPNRRMDDIVEMLKNLEPKTKRNAKNNDMRVNTDNQQTLNQFRIVLKDGDDIKKFPMNYHDDTANKVNGTSNNGTVHNVKEDTYNKRKTDANVVVESRSVVSKNGVTRRTDNLIDRQYIYNSPEQPYNGVEYQQHAYAPNENVYHHPSEPSSGAHYYEHDSSSNNNNYDHPKPGWLSFNFEDIILEKLGLAPPGKSAKGVGVMKCSQFYIVSALWRTLEQFLLKA